MSSQPAFTLEDVHAVSAVKSFDYRVRTRITQRHSLLFI